MEVYVLDSVCTNEKRLSAGEVDRIRSHFQVTDADIDKIRAYLADSSKEVRLNAIRTWWMDSTGEDCHYNRLKAIMITAYLSSTHYF